MWYILALGTGSTDVNFVRKELVSSILLKSAASQGFLCVAGPHVVAP